MFRRHRFAAKAVWIAGTFSAIVVGNRGYGLSLTVQRFLLWGGAAAAALTYGWYMCVQSARDGDPETVAGSVHVYGAVQSTFWLCLLLSQNALTPGGSAAGAILDGAFGTVFVAGLAVTFAVLLATTGVADEFSPSHLREQYREGKRERLEVEKE